MPAHSDRLPLCAAAAFAVLSLSACASADSFGNRAVAYNDQIASAQDRMLFLNIVRAAYKHPMAFTSISGATGSATVSGSLGFGLPFAANEALSPFSASPQLGASGGPTFTIANLDTQEFMKGLLTPVGLETIDLFGQEGLRWQELYELFIGEVAVVDGDGRTWARLYNTPSRRGAHAEQARRFQAFLAVLQSAQMRTEAVESFTSVGTPVAEKDIQSPDAVIKIEAAKLTAKPLAGHLYQLQKLTTGYRFCVGASDTRQLVIETDVAPAVIPVTPGMRCGASEAQRARDSAAPGQQAASPAGAASRMLGAARGGGWRLDMNLRSAEGVTYYLGEVVRQELCLDARDGCAPGHAAPVMARGDWPGDPAEPLLVATRGAAGRSDLADVRYMGQTFSLRGGPGDRSAQVLSILSQLLNLYKSAKDNPAPSIVTLVGH